MIGGLEELLCREKNRTRIWRGPGWFKPPISIGLEGPEPLHQCNSGTPLEFRGEVGRLCRVLHVSFTYVSFTSLTSSDEFLLLERLRKPSFFSSAFVLRKGFRGVLFSYTRRCSVTHLLSFAQFCTEREREKEREREREKERERERGRDWRGRSCKYFEHDQPGIASHLDEAVGEAIGGSSVPRTSLTRILRD